MPMSIGNGKTPRAAAARGRAAGRAAVGSNRTGKDRAGWAARQVDRGGVDQHPEIGSAAVVRDYGRGLAESLSSPAQCKMRRNKAGGTGSPLSVSGTGH